MKKRRELDALVNGKLGHRKKKGQHELLRNDTDSSEVEEFAIPEKAVVRKRSIGMSRLCSTCITACGFFLLTACVVAVVGLVWVHVELKKDVDDIRAQLRRVESGSQGNPEEFQQLHTKQQDLLSTLEHIQSGPRSIDSQQKSIDFIMKQIASLNSTASQLSRSLATAPELKSLPEKVTDLEQNVAKMGSGISTLQESMKQFEEFKTSVTSQLEDLTKRLDSVEKHQSQQIDSKPTEPPPTPKVDHLPDAEAIQQELSQVTQTLLTVNASLSGQLASIRAGVVQRMAVINQLHNVTEDLGDRLSLVELRPPAPKSGDPDEGQDVQALIHDAVTEALSSFQNLSSSGDTGGSNMPVFEQQLRNCTLSTIVLQEQYKTMKGQQEDVVQSIRQISNFNTTIEELADKVNNFHLHTVKSIKQTNSSLASLSERVSTLESGVGRGPSKVSTRPTTTDSPETTSLDVTADKKDIPHVNSPDGAAVSGAKHIDDFHHASQAHIDNVNTYSDLKERFELWDKDQDGHVSYSDILAVEGSLVFHEMLLKQYDSNNNNKYDLLEMTAAFGLLPVNPQKRASGNDEVHDILNAIRQQ